MINRKEQPLAPVAAAKAEVARLFAIEKDLTNQRHQSMAAVADLEKSAGASLMEGANVRDVAGSILQAQAEARVVERAIDVARRQRQDAIRRSWEVEASELRATAQKLRKQAAEIIEQCKPHLAKLAQLQGVAYDASILLAQRNDGWHDSLATGTPLAECNPFEAWADIGAAFLVPRSRVLLDQAKDREQKANALGEREIHSAYVLTKPTLDAVLNSEEFQNPEALTPAVFVIEKWAEAVEAKIRREHPELLSKGDREVSGGVLSGFTVGDVIPRRWQYRISWRDGQLDTADSSVSFPNSNSIGYDASFTAEVDQ
jgi:hypothetical protein